MKDPVAGRFKEYRAPNKFPYAKPLLSITGVEAKDRLQKRYLDDLILSHVDTLTRSNSSKMLLPVIGNKVN